MTILGTDENGNNVEVSLYDRLTGMYVIGANGTGKSTLLEQMIVQDITGGLGVCLLDPHGDLTRNVINRIPEERLADVILLDPLDADFPFGLNLFSCDDTSNPVKVEHAVEQVVQVFSKVFGMSVETPRLNQYVRHIAYTLVGTGYTMVEIPNLLLEKSFRDKVTVNDFSNSTQYFWNSYDKLRPQEQLDRSESTLDRIDSLISNSLIRNIVGQSATSINFRDIMDKGKILLVSLSARYESLTSLLGSIIIGQLLTAAISRSGTTKRRQFNLYADEYQRFATPDFATLLTEARKFGIATTIAHQVRSQLDERNAATALQAGSIICFRITSEDAEELAPEFHLTPSKAEATVPRNVLDYLDRHPNEKVKAFSATYVHKLQEASKVKTEYIPAEALNPMYDFGEGDVYFHNYEVLQALRSIQTVLYQCMVLGGVPKKEFMDALWDMAPLLKYDHLGKKGFEDYADVEVPRRVKFGDLLSDVCDILIKEKILVDSITGDIYRQNYADRANQIANELVHLKRGHAMAKLPKGEYLLITIIPEKSKADFERKRDIIVENTRRDYCRPRSEVEEEIKHRHHFSSPTTTRRMSLE